MVPVTTVKIQHTHESGDYRIINADDYDPREHELCEGEKVPDTPLRIKRKKENIDVYYKMGQERALIQEDTNRDFSSKTLGIMAFGATIFGVGLSLAAVEQSLFWIIWLGVMLLILAIMAFLGIAILSPKKWEYALYLSDLHDSLSDYDHDVLLEEVGHGYANATGHNELVLGDKASLFRWLLALGIIELAGFTILMTYPFWSNLFMIVTDPFSSESAKSDFMVTCWRKVPFFFTLGSDWDFLEDIVLRDSAGAYDSVIPGPLTGRCRGMGRRRYYEPGSVGVKGCGKIVDKQVVGLVCFA